MKYINAKSKAGGNITAIKAPTNPAIIDASISKLLAFTCSGVLFAPKNTPCIHSTKNATAAEEKTHIKIWKKVPVSSKCKKL